MKEERGEVEAQREAARLVFAERVKQSGVNKPDDEIDENSVSIFASAPIDEKERERFERQANKALRSYFDGAQKRMKKAAKEMKG